MNAYTSTNGDTPTIDTRATSRERRRENPRARGAILALIAATLTLALAGCSSAPKRPPEIFTDRNASMGQLDLANAAASKGDFANAYLFLTEAWRLALTTDDPATRVRILLAQGNTLLAEGRGEEANAKWNDALAEAEDAGDRTLAGAARISLARGSLAEGGDSRDLSREERAARAQAAKKTAESEMGNVKGNDLYAAFAWKVIGLSEKELGDAKKAEAALANAAGIHEKGRYLEDAAYDWYLIASVRSKAGLYDGARAALDAAISFDRRAENANGLGMDWMAVGMVEEKAGRPDEAKAAYRRSAEIFNAAFLRKNAAEAEGRLEALEGK